MTSRVFCMASWMRIWLPVAMAIVCATASADMPVVFSRSMPIDISRAVFFSGSIAR